MIKTIFIEELKESTTPKSRTIRIQSAIDMVSNSGGGRVVLPSGEWTICNLYLRSNLTLEIPAGCTLRASTNLDEYDNHSKGHNIDRQGYHLLIAEGVQNVCIEGTGTIEGEGGPAFWDPPLEGSPYYRRKSRRISPLLEFKNVQNFKLRDITINNSPGWTVHFFCSHHIEITGLTINNHLYGPNTDGLDINGCKHVFIHNCRIHGCDDNIIIKATEDAQTCEYITVSNCILESNCAAVGIGAETRKGIRFVTVTNCTVINAIRMIQIIMWDGGFVENAVFSNISGRAMTPVGTDRVIHFDIQEHKGENSQLGHIKNIVCSNIVAETRGRILLTAQKGAFMENITIRDVILDYTDLEDPEVSIPTSNSQQLSNFNPEARIARAALVTENVNNLVVENLTTQWSESAKEKPFPMHGAWLKNTTYRLNAPALKAKDSDSQCVIIP